MTSIKFERKSKLTEFDSNVTKKYNTDAKILRIDLVFENVLIY